ncbi:hypothetical protein CPB84DRAFT_1790435 [Gymnopilus junonius]|uniref:Uncharacterized protein n=1 Tax=Gymnopilus junonius TaxID=109634 RepID=A0A9P5NH46_GYMJU|nr:hypothetical protein CPB84DRAFT_1790435 [Gymnopilus junonius]
MLILERPFSPLSYITSHTDLSDFSALICVIIGGSSKLLQSYFRSPALISAASVIDYRLYYRTSGSLVHWDLHICRHC